MKVEVGAAGRSLALLLPPLLLLLPLHLLRPQMAGPRLAASHPLHLHLPAVLLLLLPVAGHQVEAQAVGAGVEDLP
jgi:hypothetical protein